MTGYVYMTAIRKWGAIYIGATNDLGRRIPQHKSGQGPCFTSRCGGWYEAYFDVRDAVQRESR